MTITSCYAGTEHIERKRDEKAQILAISRDKKSNEQFSFLKKDEFLKSLEVSKQFQFPGILIMYRPPHNYR